MSTTRNDHTVDRRLTTGTKGSTKTSGLITYLTIGYMVARGLAEAGSRDAYDEHDNG